MRLGRSISSLTCLLVQAAALSGCVLLSDIDRTTESHIVDDSGIGYNVTVAADDRTMHVGLDTQQAVEKRLLWAATLGVNEGPSAAEFDAIAKKWLNFQRPECKAGQGRRVSTVAYDYELSCSPAVPAK